MKPLEDKLGGRRLYRYTAVCLRRTGNFRQERQLPGTAALAISMLQRKATGAFKTTASEQMAISVLLVDMSGCRFDC